MRKIRVLVVDDSVTVRRLLTSLISAEPGLEVVGFAANGRIALERLAQLNPDLITLDMEMPEMDGLQTLAAIRAGRLTLPVIMVSSLTERGAVATLDALAAGASDYVTKPSNAGGSSQAAQRLREELIPKIKGLCRTADSSSPYILPTASAQAEPRPANRRNHVHQRVDIVAIGLSTGGPNALAELVPEFPEDFPVPVLIVQHMPPVFTRYLAERLSAKSRLPVEEGKSAEGLAPGKAWIAPGNFHMEVQRDGAVMRLRMHQDPPENSCRPAVDVLFRSVAEAYGAHSLGVIMTGMGQDGLRGCERIYEAGGRVLAQDEATSVVWGMPGFVAKAGLAEEVVPLSLMGAKINRTVCEGRSLPIRAASRATEVMAS